MSAHRKDRGAREEKFKELGFWCYLLVRRMEVETRKPLIYNEAFLEHREQVIQRDRLAPPRVLPVHKSLPSIGIYFLSINCVILFYWGLFRFFSLIYIHSFSLSLSLSLSLFYLNNVVACHAN